MSPPFPRSLDTVHVVSQRSLQLSPGVAPGAELQQGQGQGHARWGRDQVGAVLRLGERLVEADGEAVVELPHAVLKAAGAVAPLGQPEEHEDGGQRQTTHVLSWRKSPQGSTQWSDNQSCKIRGDKVISWGQKGQTFTGEPVRDPNWHLMCNK